MSIVLNTDFVGKYQIAKTQYSTDKIDEYIDKYEKLYLLKLLGAELYDLFIADFWESEPVDPIYTSIFEPFHLDLNNELIISDGIKEMLKGFIYYWIIKDGIQIQTPSGSVKPRGENGTIVGLTQDTISRFNNSVDTFRSIQTYICDNSSDYSTFNGQDISYELFF